MQFITSDSQQSPIQLLKLAGLNWLNCIYMTILCSFSYVESLMIYCIISQNLHRRQTSPLNTLPHCYSIYCKQGSKNVRDQMYRQETGINGLNTWFLSLSTCSCGSQMTCSMPLPSSSGLYASRWAASLYLSIGVGQDILVIFLSPHVLVWRKISQNGATERSKSPTTPSSTLSLSNDFGSSESIIN